MKVAAQRTFAIRSVKSELIPDTDTIAAIHDFHNYKL